MKEKTMLHLMQQQKKKNEIKAGNDGYTIEQLIDKDCADKYPEELKRLDLELIYIGLLLNNPAAISMYYFVAPLCLFADQRMINIYKGILFTECICIKERIKKSSFKTRI